MIEQIEALEYEDSILDQLSDLKTVLDIYEGKYNSFIADSEYIERTLFPVMSESEILKCSKYLIKNPGDESKEKLINRLDELELRPKIVYKIKIGYVNAKKRHDNLKAFYQLRFKKL